MIVQAYSKCPLCCGSIKMAKKHSCQLEDKLKQDVSAPCSFEGVPHHTSDSAESRSTTIKGHSVYLNLLVSACQMFHAFFYLLTRTLFLFLQKVIFFFYILHCEEKKSPSFFGWREERLKVNIVSFALKSLLRLKDLCGEAHKVH